MKKLDITIDLTKDSEDVFRQIEEVSKRIKKKTLWQRIKCFIGCVKH